ncbi:MAG: hypothetical protein FD176_351 [Rhodospirillaceae bacterium]|nr:MAG: hypothetical protein FD176_351 [Rhodospirillaceae bacterium]TNC97400.1 MAG: glycosyltransferase [Stygiobacter sp.]
MTNATPLITIVIPTYNQADWLREALHSVLAQRVDGWEAIVINNHSADHTESVVAEINDPRIRLINFANHGIIAASRNIGITEARGEWVAFLDSDDVWHADKLETCLPHLTADTDIVTHGVHFWDGNRILRDWLPGPERRAQLRNLLFEGSAMSPSATIIRHSLLQQVGGVSEDAALRSAEDYELQLKLVKVGARIRFLPLVLSKYRLHPGQQSKSAERHMEASELAVRKHYDCLPNRSWRDALRLRRRLASLQYGAGRLYQEAGDQIKARRFFARSLRQWPLAPRNWAAMLLSLIPHGPKAPHDRLPVLINGLHAKSGGGVTYLRNILGDLADDRRLQIHLLLHQDQYALFGEPPEGVRLHLLQFKTGFLRLLLWEQLALPILAREMLAVVTFSPANYGPFAAPNPVILLRNSLAVVQRDKRLNKRIYWGMLALATALSLITCRRAIAVSDYARRSLSFGLPAAIVKRVEIIHHGIAPAFTPDASVRREQNTLLAVCDIYVQKNLHTLIKAMALLQARQPSARLLIAGRIIDPDYHGELLRQIEHLNMGNVITFLGGCSQERLIELYRSCTVFVFPSTIETFGNPLVEAMACGAPIASSNTSAMPEVVGDAARLFDPLDTQAMAEAISGLLDDPAARAELSRRGLERAHLYSWKQTAAKTADVLVDAARRN